MNPSQPFIHKSIKTVESGQMRFLYIWDLYNIFVTLYGILSIFLLTMPFSCNADICGFFLWFKAIFTVAEIHNKDQTWAYRIIHRSSNTLLHRITQSSRWKVIFNSINVNFFHSNIIDLWSGLLLQLYRKNNSFILRYCSIKKHHFACFKVR